MSLAGQPAAAAEQGLFYWPGLPPTIEGCPGQTSAKLSAHSHSGGGLRNHDINLAVTTSSSLNDIIQELSGKSIMIRHNFPDIVEN